MADPLMADSLKGAAEVVPGEILTPDETIALGAGRERVALIVENSGDRPIQVGSHYHFAAANPALSFDRAAARGCRLDVPAGTSVRIEPGVSREVALVALAGARVIPGLRPEWAGPLDAPAPAAPAPGGSAPAGSDD